jgi:hypothetical protein
MSERLRLRQDGLGWRALEGEVVALDSPRGIYLGTNESGTVLWEALAEGTTREELARKLIDLYGIAEDEARRDVDAFLAEAERQELLERQ